MHSKASCSGIMDTDTKQVTFTLAELWMINDLVPTPYGLTEEIALAINGCLEVGSEDYVTELSRGWMLRINELVMRDAQSVEGAQGIEILKKIFKALSELGLEIGTNRDRTYKEVHNAEPNDDTDEDSGTAVSRRGPRPGPGTTTR